ncbi:MAG: hypothetical protein IAF08_14990 [Rhizobacter sp.]|nr:hypothetical protein [Chlorobiales bacterium]
MMTTAKEEMIQLIQAQPDDSSYDELLKELLFAQMIARGLTDSAAGRTLSHADFKAKLKTWRK